MSGISPEVWSRLAADHPIGEALRARRAMPNISTRLLAALDAASERHLLVLLLDGEEDLQDLQSRGLSIETRALEVLGHDPGRYLDISCKDPAGHDAFDLIGQELADRLAASEETAPELASRVVAKWRRFWGQLPRQMLTREEQLGLFAEVWFLSIWLFPRVGPAAADRWRGPHRARHDFEWPGLSVEVKATTSMRGRIHLISGIEQLASPDRGRLMFFSLRLREEGGASNTLPSVIAACRASLELSPDALSRFEATLSIAGYSAVYEHEYAKMRLRVVEEGLYRVEDDFPRLIPASFPAGVPAGIEQINYEINLASSSHLIVATNTAQAFEF